MEEDVMRNMPAMNRIFLWCLSSVAMGCGEASPPENNGPSIAPVATPGESSYTDPETGTVYQINSNRRVVSGGGAPAATQSRELPNGTTEVQSAVNASGTDTDYSGLVQTQVVEGISRGPVTGNISGGCSVSPDYVLIGGGAQDVWSQPGALLWESRPQDVDNSGPGTTWLASSKDHLSAANHI